MHAPHKFCDNMENYITEVAEIMLEQLYPLSRVSKLADENESRMNETDELVTDPIVSSLIHSVPLHFAAQIEHSALGAKTRDF